MISRALFRCSLSLGFALALGACVSQAPELEPREPQDNLVDTRLRRNVDVLFVVDNSSRMAAKQKYMGQAIDDFVARLDASGVNYHIGVVTTDVGTLPPPGIMFPGVNDPRCGTFKGDDGLLQNTSCRLRTTNVSTEFTTECAASCPMGTALPTQRFISRENGVPNVADPAAALRCMALVGDSGCGVESPLEAMKRALDGHLADNRGFLRAQSTLAVIFLTDEDDCSVKFSERARLNPSSQDCHGMSGDLSYHCYNLDYRCMAKNLECDQPLSTTGPTTGCRERKDSFLEPVDTYSKFLLRLRPANKLVLSGIWSPSILDFNDGITTPFGNGQLQVAHEDLRMARTNTLNRGFRTQAACYNPEPSLTTDPLGYSGQAQLRLDSFKNKFPSSIWTRRNICDAENYGAALNAVAGKVVTASGIDCVGGGPSCEVGFVHGDAPTQLQSPALPRCGTTCCSAWAGSNAPIGEYGGTLATRDPTIVAACTPEAQDCYCSVDSLSGLCPASDLVGVWRVGDAEPPAQQLAKFRCEGAAAE